MYLRNSLPVFKTKNQILVKNFEESYILGGWYSGQIKGSFW